MGNYYKNVKTFIALALLFQVANMQAQTINTATSGFVVNNGSGIVTFNFQNTNSSSVTITSILAPLYTQSPATFKVWYRATPMNGLLGAPINAANGWTLASTNAFTSTIGVINGQTQELVLPNLSIVIPANTTYAMAVSGFITAGTGGAMGYYSMPATPATVTMSSSGCNLITGANISYASTTEAGNPTFTPRGWVGTINFTTGSTTPVCPVPTALAASSITTTTASLNWTQTGTPASWQIKYGPPGFNPASAGTAINTTTHPYTLNPPLLPATTYDFYVRAVCSAGDTSAWSTVSTFTTNCVSPNLLSTTPASRCGTGDVTLAATADVGANIKWYASATGGTSLATGSSYTTPTLSTTTTYYVSAASGSSTGAGVIRITEMDLGGTDALEIQNVGSQSIDVTGWKVAISNSYTSITSVNPNIQTLSGTMAPGAIKTWSDLSTATNYWGSNMLWNPGAGPTYTGWIIIIDNNGNLVDFVSENWPTATVQATTLTIGTASVNLATAWTGNPLDGSTTGINAGNTFQRTGSSDNNMASDFVEGTGTIGTTNTGLLMPFGGASCESARQPVIATIKALPIVNLGNDTTLCPGVSYTFNAQNAGGTYAWSTGASTQTITSNVAGNFYVTVTATNNCVASDTIQITPGITPVNVLGPTTNLCAGDVATLNAGNNGCTFLWSPGGQTTQTITASTGGNHAVAIKSIHGCVINSNTNLIIRPLPVPNLAADTTICEGSAITLNAGNAGYAYGWSTGATTQAITAVDSGTYTVTTTSPYNCSITESQKISYWPAPKTEGFNFIPQFYDNLGEVLFSPLNPTNVNAYEWDFGDGSAVSTQMNPSHIFALGGNYDVTLKVFNDCGSTQKNQVITLDLTTGTVSVKMKDAKMSIYPNPARDYVTVENLDASIQMNRVNVYNAVGSLVYSKELKANKIQIPVGGLAAGMYAVKVWTEDGFAVKKLEIIK